MKKFYCSDPFSCRSCSLCIISPEVFFSLGLGCLCTTGLSLPSPSTMGAFLPDFSVQGGLKLQQISLFLLPISFRLLYCKRVPVQKSWMTTSREPPSVFFCFDHCWTTSVSKLDTFFGLVLQPLCAKFCGKHLLGGVLRLPLPSSDKSDPSTSTTLPSRSVNNVHVIGPTSTTFANPTAAAHLHLADGDCLPP